MKTVLSDRALIEIADAPVPVRKAFYKQLAFLERDLRHPSLRAKKYDESAGIWQARVNKDCRFYFTIEGDICRIPKVVQTSGTTSSDSSGRRREARRPGDRPLTLRTTFGTRKPVEL